MTIFGSKIELASQHLSPYWHEGDKDETASRTAFSAGQQLLW
jgi:hypothetical protein